MVSPLSGSLRKTVGQAFTGIFLPATLKRGTTTYPCRAIYEEYGTGYGAGASQPSTNVKALVLAETLGTEPGSGDIVTIRETTFAKGDSFMVLSTNPAKPAVSTDPAGAVWTLRGRSLALQAGPDQAIVGMAELMGSPHDVYRSTGSDPIAPGNKVGPVSALMLSGSGSGYNANRPMHDDEVWETALVDASKVRVGDFLVADRTYFIGAIEPSRPVSAVLCNRVVSLKRGNSQIDADGGQAEGLPSQSDNTGRYWGQSSAPDDDDQGPGELAIRKNVPVALQALAGAARGQGQTPSDAPGPNRWRAYLPASVFPFGSVKTRDTLTDDLANRYLIMTDDWTPTGYKIEMIRLEN